MAIQRLTLKQKKFCIKYIENGGNGAEAALASGYKVKSGSRNTAAVIAYENLTKPHVKDYLKTLYTAHGLDEAVVEREHAYLIEQRDDLSVKARSIEMYYKINGKYANGDSYEDKVNAELEDALKRIRDVLPN